MRLLQDPQDGTFLAKVRDRDIVILDDLGMEYQSKKSDWMKGQVDAIITHRYNELKPTIITTNLPLQPRQGDTTRANRPRTLQDTIGERAFSRLMSDVGELYATSARVPEPLLLPYRVVCWRAVVDIPSSISA